MSDLYKVEGKTEQRRLRTDGEVEIIYRIRAITKGGTTFSEDIPESWIGTKKVDEALEKKAQALDSIQ